MPTPALAGAGGSGFAAALSDPDATQVASLDDLAAQGLAADTPLADETSPYERGRHASSDLAAGAAAAAGVAAAAGIAGHADVGTSGPSGAESMAESIPGITDADVTSTWGVPGTSSWARASAEPAAAAVETPPPPTWQTLPVYGPSGEQLAVTVLEVLDPADSVLTGAGFRMEPGQRAVLVHSSVANNGQVPYYPVGDLYLVLETTSRQLLGRAAIAVGSHPAFPVGVVPGQTTHGWSVFLIPSEVGLAGIKWCIRPDLPQTILSWPIQGQ
jgi:hypothetical protein